MSDYLDSRDIAAPLTRQMSENMCRLLVAINMLRDRYSKPLIVSSGYRPASLNAAAGGRPGSAHMTCEAIDIADANGELKKWLVANPSTLEDLDLYQEDPTVTTTWVHLQTRKTASGKRIFLP